MTIQKAIKQVHLGTELNHKLIYPEKHGKLPGILLIHEYTGLSTAVLKQAERLATEGFAVLAADFYGVHNRPQNINQARKIHRIYRDDRLLMRERAKVCLQALAEQPEVDNQTITALGFSFGGGCALELARSGAEIKRAVSVYGYLDTSHPAQQHDIKCPLLVLHVNNDPVVPQKHAAQFRKEMNAAGADWQLIELDGLKHGFANPVNPEFNKDATDKMWAEILEWIF